MIVSSGILFLWLAAVSLFEYFYRPARQGHKVVYLTLCSFAFMCAALATVFYGGHGSGASSANSLNSSQPVAVAQSSNGGVR